MDAANAGLEGVSRLIHLAVAPIFLLTAVATTLTVLAARLARVVDRGRFLEGKGGLGREEELAVLERRAHLIYRAFSLGIWAALSVCLLMTTAFLGEMLGFAIAKPAAALFLSALFCYTGALLCMLREVFLAIENFELRIHPAAPPAVKP